MGHKKKVTQTSMEHLQPHYYHFKLKKPYILVASWEQENSNYFHFSYSFTFELVWKQIFCLNICIQISLQFESILTSRYHRTTLPYSSDLTDKKGGIHFEQLYSAVDPAHLQLKCTSFSGSTFGGSFWGVGGKSPVKHQPLLQKTCPTTLKFYI